MPDLIPQAVSLLRSGRLVAFPTETVYGLGADATNADAITRIYIAKGRPSTNPLIIHIADKTVARRYALDWPDTADHLASCFWPGPLTLVVPKSPAIVDEATAGKPTVGLRAPNHPLTLQLLKEFDGPLAGPSANRSTRISPTTAQHVRDDLGDAVDLILDGGPCTVGIESTVLDLTCSPPRILRPGGISRAQIEAEIGSVDLFQGSLSPDIAAASPGQHAIHYAPSTPAFRFDAQALSHAIAWCIAHKSDSWAILTLGRRPEVAAAFSALPRNNERLRLVVEMPDNPADYARRLYRELHRLDQQHFDAILVEFPPNHPAWHALRDRLQRATQPLEAP